MSVYAIQEVEYQALFRLGFSASKSCRMCVSIRVRASKLFTYRAIVLMHYLATLLPIQSHKLAFQSTSKQLTTAITPLDVHLFPNTTK